ncbi:MAG: helix-turn-helix transcriptional regulator [Candidatus Kapabacteria bacterium]|nr:helix-turn-helix transcriptional regulator [Candidatus Kapabacteria bacterium]
MLLLSPKNDTLIQSPISDREAEVLELIAQGKSSKQIAGMLFISTNTVNTHRQRIIEKLGVSNTAQAVDKFRKYVATA